MPKSTANFIAYDVRPSKQIERRAIIDLLGSARNAGYEIPSYRYVGFGGTKFIDFHLMQRYIGFDGYVSVEHDEDIYNRCFFNKPFEELKMHKGPLSEFLLVDENQGNSVYWLDFEVGVSQGLANDLSSAAEHVVDGDILLVTISGELPSGTRNKSDTERRKIIGDRLAELRASISQMPTKAFSEANFRKTAGQILLLMLSSAFATRVNDGEFWPIMKVLYKDSAWMCTVGGVFSKKGSRRSGKLRRLAKNQISAICNIKPKEFFTIPDFNFTELERLLLDKSDISSGKGYSRRLISLGLNKDDLAAYQSLARLIPKYVEAAF